MESAPKHLLHAKWLSARNARWQQRLEQETAAARGSAVANYWGYSPGSNHEHSHEGHTPPGKALEGWEDQDPDSEGDEHDANGMCERFELRGWDDPWQRLWPPPPAHQSVSCTATSAAARATGAGEGNTRAEVVSLELARRCAVGQGLLELAGSDVDMPETARNFQQQQQQQPPAAVVVPGVPAGVPSVGLCLLDVWARNAEEHGPYGPWLADFLNSSTGRQLAETMLAADFLQCQEFLLQAADAALLFLVTASSGVLACVARGHCPPMELQAGADAAMLPYISRDSSACNSGGASGSSSQLAAHRPAARVVSPQRLEALVEGIDASGMLPRAVNRDDIRVCLLRIGFRPRLSARRDVPGRPLPVEDGSLPYLSLDLPADAMRRYRVAAVHVAGSTHDQGDNSNGARGHHTDNGSWTWADVMVYQLSTPALEPLQQQLPPVSEGAAATASGAGASVAAHAGALVLHKQDRVWTNSHADGSWQEHRRTFATDSELVCTINGAAAAIGASTAAGCSAPAGLRLVLQVAAGLPCWIQHWIRAAGIRVDLVPK